MFDETKTNGGAVTNLDFASGGSPLAARRGVGGSTPPERVTRGEKPTFQPPKVSPSPLVAPLTLQKSYHVVPAKLLLSAPR